MSASSSAKSICLCVTGGVAAYKSAHLASRLTQAGIDVHVAITSSGLSFVGSATFLALTGNPVIQSVFHGDQAPYGGHIQLAATVDILAVVPATADFLAKAAHGDADCIASATYLAFQGPVFIAPAMNSAMWAHPATQRNVGILKDDGVTILEPDNGWLSCRQTGQGRLKDIDQILEILIHSTRQ
ncbi:MAG: phosphopantothenoylcysteine decarboxylase [Planctomycetaceae bacterium]|nr:phosphopantothenoylcysteine decarboxylase [Planctomycetaceae bacterium]